MPSAPQRFRKLHLRPQHRQQSRVVPGLLDEVAGAAPHRLDRQIDATPRRHHHDGQSGIGRLNLREQI